jgi:hypothetical protein
VGAFAVGVELLTDRLVISKLSLRAKQTELFHDILADPEIGAILEECLQSWDRVVNVSQLLPDAFSQ